VFRRYTLIGAIGIHGAALDSASRRTASKIAMADHAH